MGYITRDGLGLASYLLWGVLCLNLRGCSCLGYGMGYWVRVFGGCGFGILLVILFLCYQYHSFLENTKKQYPNKSPSKHPTSSQPYHSTPYN